MPFRRRLGVLDFEFKDLDQLWFWGGGFFTLVPAWVPSENIWSDSDAYPGCAAAARPLSCRRLRMGLQGGRSGASVLESLESLLFW